MAVGGFKFRISFTCPYKLLSLQVYFRDCFGLFLRSQKSLFSPTLYRGLFSNRIMNGSHPVGIYLLKVNNRNTRTRCEMCSKLTIKTFDIWTYFTPCSRVSIVNFKHVNAGYVRLILPKQFTEYLSELENISYQNPFLYIEYMGQGIQNLSK